MGLGTRKAQKNKRAKSVKIDIMTKMRRQRDYSAMRPKARWLVQHDGPPGWLEESYPPGCDFVRDGRSMPLKVEKIGEEERFNKERKGR